MSVLGRRVEEEYSASYPPWLVWTGPSTASLTSITPATAVVSQTALAQLDCTGTGFTAGARIMRDGVPLITTVVTPGTVLRTTAFFPTPVGTINVRVQNDGQLPTNARVFTVTATMRELEEVEPEPEVEVERPEAQAEEYPAGAAEEPSSEPPPPERRPRKNGRARS